MNSKDLLNLYFNEFKKLLNYTITLKNRLKKDLLWKYQLNIAESSTKKNTLVVLPTGLGKTIIALILITKNLKNKNQLRVTT